MDLECRWGNQHHQERTHRSSGDTMGTGSYQRRFPSRPSEAGDRLRSNVVSHDRLRSNVVHEKQVSASSMSLSHNVDTDPSKMNVCSCTYLYLDVFVHKFKNTFMNNSESSKLRSNVVFTRQAEKQLRF